MDINTLPLRHLAARQDLALTAEDYEQWPYTLACVRQALAGLSLPPLTIITGENGAGKSTLVESIAEAYGLPLAGGDTRAARPGWEKKSAFGQDLHLTRGAASRRAGLFLRAEGTLAYLEYMASLDSTRAHKALKLSHGQGIQRLLEESFDNYGLWLLDEPESGLSFGGQLELSAHILAFLDQGGQVILSTHSPILAALALKSQEPIWHLGEWGIELRAWAELDMTAHWRTFLDDPEAYLRHL